MKLCLVYQIVKNHSCSVQWIMKLSHFGKNTSAWTSSYFTEIEFHWVWKLWVQTHIKFKDYESFKLAFQDLSNSSFSKIQNIKLKIHWIWYLSCNTRQLESYLVKFFSKNSWMQDAKYKHKYLNNALVLTSDSWQ